MKQRENFWQHRHKTFYAIGLNEKEEDLYLNGHIFLFIVLDFSSYETTRFYLYLFVYLIIYLFICLFIYLFISVDFYAMYLIFDLFIISSLHFHFVNLLELVLFLIILTLNFPLEPSKTL